MILIPLAILDILSAASILLYHFEIVPGRLALPLFLHLVSKGVLFRDIMSFLDMLAGLYGIGMMVFGFNTLLAYVLAIHLIQKGIMSFRAYT